MFGEEDLRALAAQAQAGDAAAWEQLYRHAYPPMVGYARRRLGSQIAADDAVSEAMVRAIAGVHRFEWRSGGITGWLFGILRFVVLETYRTGGRTAALDDETLLRMEDIDLGPGDRLLADEEACMARAAFEELHAEDRELLELRVIAGLDAEAVGMIVGKRPGAVRTAQSRAMARLRQHVQERS